jgi:hypothetical protein
VQRGAQRAALVFTIRAQTQSMTWERRSARNLVSHAAACINIANHIIQNQHFNLPDCYHNIPLTMMQLTLRLVLLMGASVSLSTSFVSRASKQHTRAFSTASYALTERQMQFWEDVDKGLDDIENFFAKKGQDIDRIRQFAKRCVRVKEKNQLAAR